MERNRRATLVWEGCKQARREKEKEKGKTKIQEENEPEFEIPQSLPTQQEIDTARLNSLLLASTLMQTMRTRAEELNKEDNSFKALEAVATTSLDNYKDNTTYKEYKSTNTDVPQWEQLSKDPYPFPNNQVANLWEKSKPTTKTTSPSQRPWGNGKSLRKILI